MKIAVIVDLPENNIPVIEGERIIPSYADVTLDYGDKVLYLNGKIEEYK